MKLPSTFEAKIICSHCGALKLPNENPSMCCCNGRVILSSQNIPPVLQYMLSSVTQGGHTFRSKIRMYNSAFTFASIGVKLDRQMANAIGGVYTYRAQGQFYHYLGSLLPGVGAAPQYAQMYIYDTEHELNHRSNAIPNSSLDQTLLQILKRLLDKFNPYTHLFRSINTYPNISELSLKIHCNIKGLDQRTHNAPTASQVAAIWIDGQSETGEQNRDITLRSSMDTLLKISEFDGCYDPLAYPLLFPNGEQGWCHDFIYFDYDL